MLLLAALIKNLCSRMVITMHYRGSIAEAEKAEDAIPVFHHLLRTYLCVLLFYFMLPPVISTNPYIAV
jgi:hypothetical protein